MLFYHRLRVFYMYYTHILDFFRRKQTKLHLLNRAQRRAGILKVEVRHDDGWQTFDLVIDLFSPDLG